MIFGVSRRLPTFNPTRLEDPYVYNDTCQKSRVARTSFAILSITAFVRGCLLNIRPAQAREPVNGGFTEILVIISYDLPSYSPSKAHRVVARGLV